MDEIEKKDDAMSLEIEKKSKKRKETKTKNLSNIVDGNSCLKAAGNLAKKGVRESTECNRMSTEKAQIEGKEQGPLDEPDCDLESRKKKRKHEVHQKELGNENVSTSIKITEGENVFSGEVVHGKSSSHEGESNIELTVKRRDVENSEGSKLKKVLDNSSEEPKSKRKSKKVRFSGQVDVFPLNDTENEKPKREEDSLVRGKRFTLEEDEKVKEAVLNYLKSHDLGEKGLTKVLNCRSHCEIKNCWKEIGSCIPYRPYTAIYYRAHILFERAEKREWTAKETEILQKSYEKHGNNWKKVAEELGKHRIHVKDKWRRIKHGNTNRGKWSQEEYQSLYDLVNLDLQTKISSREKKSKHGMLRDDIPWGAVSDKLSTRNNATCCQKWYRQLTSSLVAEDKWSNADDYRLISVLYDLDAACVEDVDWDGLLEHRSGEVCRKRWDQMVLHIGHHGSNPFSEQVEILSKRYCPDLAETREAWDNKPSVQ